MNHVYKIISLPISILSILTCSSLASDQYFKDCEPVKCGVNIITYPFYVPGLQKSFCGHSGFEVNCNSGNLTTIELSNNSYTIRRITYEQQLVILVNSAFTDTKLGCDANINNFTLDNKRFKFATNNHSEIIFLQNCDEEAKNSISNYKEVLCVYNNKRSESESEVVLYAHQADCRKFAGKCGKVVYVPYEGPDASDSDSVVKAGFSLNWVASSCSMCASSGGRCGYLNESGSTIQCFCPHGVNPHACPSKFLFLVV